MKTAVILAAGRGERLRPLTDRIPKSMCCVLGKPLIEHHIIHLKRAGIERIIINHAYLGSIIKHHLGDGARWGVDLVYSAEPPGALETGGALYNVMPLIGTDPFITVNADIFTHFDFKALPSTPEALVHLVLVPKNAALKHHGDFGLDEQQRLTNENKNYTFSGIACYTPDIFEALKPGRYSVAPLMRHYASLKQATGQVYSGTWFDIGSMERLHAANQALESPC